MHAENGSYLGLYRPQQSRNEVGQSLLFACAITFSTKLIVAAVPWLWAVATVAVYYNILRKYENS